MNLSALTRCTASQRFSAVGVDHNFSSCLQTDSESCVRWTVSTDVADKQDSFWRTQSVSSICVSTDRNLTTHRIFIERVRFLPACCDLHGKLRLFCTAEIHFFMAGYLSPVTIWQPHTLTAPKVHNFHTFRSFTESIHKLLLQFWLYTSAAQWRALLSHTMDVFSSLFETV